jgi:NADP-dependent aldehyde dehydrogenase
MEFPIMSLTGEMLIGATAIRGLGGRFQAINPATGETLEPAYESAGPAEVERACALADAAFDAYRETLPEARAQFLEAIADAIMALGEALIERAVAETGLPTAPITGERGRTTGQLRLFAAVVRDGAWMDLRIDPALPDRTPLPRSDLRLRMVGVGPVAVFGASNFPLAFSVAGGTQPIPGRPNSSAAPFRRRLQNVVCRKGCFRCCSGWVTGWVAFWRRIPVYRRLGWTKATMTA